MAAGGPTGLKAGLEKQSVQNGLENHQGKLKGLTDAQLAFGHVALLDHAGFALEAGERVALTHRARERGTQEHRLAALLQALRTPGEHAVVFTLVAGKLGSLARLTPGQRDRLRDRWGFSPLASHWLSP